MLKGNINELGPGPRKIPNYPVGRSPYKNRHPRFDWRGTEEGQRALLVLFFFVEARLNVVQIVTGASYAEYGITKETTTAFLKRAVPEVFDRYLDDIGDTMPLELPIRRIYMWFLDHEGKGLGCRKIPTDEWPPRWASSEQYSRGLSDALKAG